MPSDTARRRCAAVGLGTRARLFTAALAGPYADRVELVGFCDVNPHRMAVHNEWTGASVPAGAPRASRRGVHLDGAGGTGAGRHRRTARGRGR